MQALSRPPTEQERGSEGLGLVGKILQGAPSCIHRKGKNEWDLCGEGCSGFRVLPTKLLFPLKPL